MAEPVATVLLALLGTELGNLAAGGFFPKRSLIGSEDPDPEISRDIPGYPGRGTTTFQFLHVEAANWSHHVTTMMALLYRVLANRISYAIAAKHQWK